LTGILPLHAADGLCTLLFGFAFPGWTAPSPYIIYILWNAEKISHDDVGKFSREFVPIVVSYFFIVERCFFIVVSYGNISRQQEIIGSFAPQRLMLLLVRSLSDGASFTVRAALKPAGRITGRRVWMACREI